MICLQFRGLVPKKCCDWTLLDEISDLVCRMADWSPWSLDFSGYPRRESFPKRR